MTRPTRRTVPDRGAIQVRTQQASREACIQARPRRAPPWPSHQPSMPPGWFGVPPSSADDVLGGFTQTMGVKVTPSAVVSAHQPSRPRTGNSPPRAQ